MHRERLTEVVTATRDYVRYLQRLGVEGLLLSRPSLPAAVVEVMGTEQTPAAGVSPVAATGTGPQAPLDELAVRVRTCSNCRLHQSRTQVVFGVGNPAADLVFVGEAPGYEEDRRGEPFVGPAGQLLTRIIHAIGLRREQVYILNVVKCRPPQNRNPLADEVAACRPILQAQLACLRPRVICALGTFAAQALLQTEEKISRLRGRFHRLGEIEVMPTYHPAYLLRNPREKRATWEDMQAIQRLLGLG